MQQYKTRKAGKSDFVFINENQGKISVPEMADALCLTKGQVMYIRRKLGITKRVQPTNVNNKTNKDPDMVRAYALSLAVPQLVDALNEQESIRVGYIAREKYGMNYTQQTSMKVYLHRKLNRMSGIKLGHEEYDKYRTASFRIPLNEIAKVFADDYPF